VQYKDDLIAFSTHTDKVKRFKIFKTGIIIEDQEITDGYSEEWVLKFMRISRKSGTFFEIEINDGSFYASVIVLYNNWSERKWDSMYSFSNSI
jgi:hypothetical protein